jgi:membrane protein implicated in regulation of membrane protease activity
MDYIGWLIVFVVFAALELATMGLTCIWFAVGAVAACIASLLGGDWLVQSIVFIIVTVLVLIFLRPFAVKYINNKAEKTNVESMAGKTGKVIKEIDNINATGLIIVDGVEWTARSSDGAVIPQDSLVTVISVEGVKAIVKKA